MGTLLLALGTSGVAVAAGLFAMCLKLRSSVEFLLATYLLATAEIVGISLVLSAGRWLTRGALLAALSAILALAVIVWSRSGRPRPPLTPRGLWAGVHEVLGDRVVTTLAAIVALVYAYLLLVALTVPQSAADALLYHLPRAAFWRQQHGVAYVANSPEEPVNAHPPNAEIETMSSMILGGSDRYVGLVQMVAVLVTSIAVYGTSRRLGLGARAAAFGAVTFSTLTIVVLQAPTALNDLVLASLLMSTAFFAVGTSRTELMLGSLALALALGTKVATIFALPVLALFALTAQPRRRWLGLAVAGAVGLAAGSYWYVVNLVETGKIDGGLAAAFPQWGEHSAGAILERIWLLGADLLELSTGEGQGELLRPLTWGLAALGLGAIAALVLATRGRRLTAGAVLLGGLFVLLASPTVSAWSELGARASRRAGAVFGVGTAPTGPRLPAGFYESELHSAYGLAFLLLYLTAAALVVHGTIRRTLPTAALTAMAGLPLFLVVFALPLQYDPQRMRFFAFPVALATAVFGVVLRLRLVAWVSVALTAIGLVVTLGYFTPRPGGLALLPGNRGPDRNAKWHVQSESGVVRADAEAFRFLEDEMPVRTTIALAVLRDTPLYPAWNAGLDRRVVFASTSGEIPEEAEWLVIGPGGSMDVAGLRKAGWRLRLATERGWRIFER